MTHSTTMIKIRRFILPFFAILFWLSVWQICAMILDKPYFLPDVFTTFSTFFGFFTTTEFYRVTLFSILRVILGLLLGVISGAALAVLSHRLEIVRAIVSPLISVIKSTPVASFIMVLWILLNGNALAIFVAVLMVVPIIWQNLMDGYSAIDPQLSELCTVYDFSPGKRFRLLTLPTLMRYFLPALITSSGLAWKAEIAAEIIAYTKDSVGQMINDAKYELRTSEVFAWTLVVIILSILLEKLTKGMLKRLGERRQRYGLIN